MHEDEPDEDAVFGERVGYDIEICLSDLCTENVVNVPYRLTIGEYVFEDTSEDSRIIVHVDGPRLERCHVEWGEPEWEERDELPGWRIRAPVSYKFAQDVDLEFEDPAGDESQDQPSEAMYYDAAAAERAAQRFTAGDAILKRRLDEFRSQKPGDDQAPSGFGSVAAGFGVLLLVGLFIFVCLTILLVLWKIVAWAWR